MSFVRTLWDEPCVLPCWSLGGFRDGYLSSLHKSVFAEEYYVRHCSRICPMLTPLLTPCISVASRQQEDFLPFWRAGDGHAWGFYKGADRPDQSKVPTPYSISPGCSQLK